MRAIPHTAHTFAPASTGDPLFVRLEAGDGKEASALAGLKLRVEFLVPGREAPLAVETPVATGAPVADGVRVALGSALEARVPLGFARTGPLVFRAVLLDAQGRDAERIPADGWVRFTPPGPASSASSLLRRRVPAPP